MESFVPWLALIVVFIHLNFCTGLKCKQGVAKMPEGREESTVEECPLSSEEYCVSVMCSSDKIPGFAIISWGCALAKRQKEKFELAAKKFAEQNGKMTKLFCECKFGEKGKDNDNVQFALPSATTSKALQCKDGFLTAKDGYGQVAKKYCYTSENYCYAANCFSADGQGVNLWDCSESNDCAAVEKKLKQFNLTTCRCSFGGKNVDLANENFMLPPVMQPMSTEVDPQPVMPTPTAEGTQTTTTETSPPAMPMTSTEISPSAMPTKATEENLGTRPTFVAMFCAALMTIGLVVTVYR